MIRTREEYEELVKSHTHILVYWIDRDSPSVEHRDTIISLSANLKQYNIGRVKLTFGSRLISYRSEDSITLLINKQEIFTCGEQDILDFRQTC